MRKPEQRVWDSMRRAAPKHLWMERVENLVADGMPDVHVAADARISWVELKHGNLPVRAATRLLGNDGLRISQINWHLKAASMNLPCYTLIRDDNMELYLVEARFADRINDMCAADLRAVRCAGSWADVFNVLTKGVNW